MVHIAREEKNQGNRGSAGTSDMAGFHWSDAMSVGIPALDSDHRCLVRIINLLAEGDHGAESRTTLETVLETVTIYARYHFAREERLLEACGFPAADVHRAEHEEFSRFVEQLRARFAGRAGRKVAGELLEFLGGWLRHHILIQDMAYKPYVRAMNQPERVALHPRRPAHGRRRVHETTMGKA